MKNISVLVAVSALSVGVAAQVQPMATPGIPSRENLRKGSTPPRGIPTEAEMRKAMKPRLTPTISPAASASKPEPSVLAASNNLGVDAGSVVGKTYTNKELGFEVTFPDTWLIPGDDFEGFMREKGYDLRVKVANTDPQMKANVRRFEKNVVLLLTAYRSMPGTKGNSIVHISVEDLTDSPQIKDAVDYFDLMRSQISTMKLPAGFSVSEVQAEKLGSKQFGYLETQSGATKKRMYASVKGPRAIMFTISYSADDDLAVLRRMLEEGNFSLK